MPTKKRFQSRTDMKIAFIGDEDTCAGFALAGCGMIDGQDNKNFFIVDSATRKADIENAFKELTQRKDIGILLINQTYANDIRNVVTEYNAEGNVVPTVLEIPSKDQPYDAKTDPIMQRVQVFFGEKSVL